MEDQKKITLSEDAEIEANKTAGEDNEAADGEAEKAAETVGEAIETVEDGEKTDLEEDAELEEGEEPEPQFEKLFTLSFRISPEELYDFQMTMGRLQIEKNKKRTMIMGAIEIIFGAFYLISILVTGEQMGVLQVLLALALIGMGVYGVVFYRLLFEKQIQKAVQKQHSKTPYFQKEIVVDIYPNKCTEYIGSEKIDTLWRKIIGVRESGTAFIIELEQKRCLLIPKVPLGEDLQKFDDFLKQMCENFEKPREQV